MQVVIAPDTRLRIQTRRVKKISPTLIQTLKEMVKLTKTFKDPEGVGLAATQIGMAERYFVGTIGENNDEKRKGLKSFINPVINWYSKRTKKYFEGCLSIPDTWGETIRATSVKATYLDDKGIKHSETLKGTDAWIFQHEVDHLDGILFADRVLQQQGKFYKFNGKDKAGGDIFTEIALP